MCSLFFFFCLCVHARKCKLLGNVEGHSVRMWIHMSYQWSSKSLGFLPRRGKECPADGSCAPITHRRWLLTLSVLAPTQSYTYLPFFHHAIITSLVPYPCPESKEQIHQLSASTQPPLCTIICSIIHPQALQLNKNLFCLFLNSCYFERRSFLRWTWLENHLNFDHTALFFFFLLFQHIWIKSAYARLCG